MTSAQGYTVGLLSAAAIHAALLFGIRPTEGLTPPEFGIEPLPPGVEVTLVAALPAPEPEPLPAPEPEPEPVVEPAPVPTEPIEPGESSIIPAPEPEPKAEPEPALPPQRPAAPVRAKATAPRPKHSARPTAFGDGSSAVPGDDATSANASAGNASARPGYLRNPHPPYPEEARRAGHEGVVHLKVMVNERGRVTSVSITRSSGHPSLDERALSTIRDRWLFKPARRGNTSIAAEVIVPVRFTLEKR
jgi:protein TonB